MAAMDNEADADVSVSGQRYKILGGNSRIYAVERIQTCVVNES